jgi:uncharacterized protein YabN with tetrapyrrole methylase and pyrophosphatase domain
VLRNWEALKAEEKKKRQSSGAGAVPQTANQSALAGVSSTMPALLEAHKLSSRAAHVGFDWPEIAGLFEKLSEETKELQQELEHLPTSVKSVAQGVAGSGKAQIPEQLRRRIEEEVGDLFFVMVNIARYLGLDSESALKKANRKFRRRFQWMEEQLLQSGRTPQQSNADELESLWRKAKQHEAKAVRDDV